VLPGHRRSAPHHAERPTRRSGLTAATVTPAPRERIQDRRRHTRRRGRSPSRHR
jgi:hypothetical protein